MVKTATKIMTTFPPLSIHANGFRTYIPAAAPVDVEGDGVDAVGAVVESGCGVVDVAIVVGAAAVEENEEEEEQEVDVEEVVAAARTGAVVFVLGTQLELAAAVPVRCAQLFLVLLLLSSPSSGFSGSS